MIKLFSESNVISFGLPTWFRLGPSQLPPATNTPSVAPGLHLVTLCAWYCATYTLLLSSTNTAEG